MVGRWRARGGGGDPRKALCTPRPSTRQHLHMPHTGAEVGPEKAASDTEDSRPGTPPPPPPPTPDEGDSEALGFSIAGVAMAMSETEALATAAAALALGERRGGRGAVGTRTTSPLCQS